MNCANETLIHNEREDNIVLVEYRKHVEEQAVEGLPPKSLNPEQVTGLIELLKNPPAGEEAFLVELIADRVPPGVDEAAYVKAGFLTAIIKDEATSPVPMKYPVRLLASQNHRRWLIIWCHHQAALNGLRNAPVMIW